jgi:acetolactate synthase I/III small subunit
MRHTLSIVVADQPGELSRIVGLFSARGFNIETVSVGETADPHWSRVTIVTRGDDRTVEQIVKQCQRLARVREVQDVTRQPHIEREMVLVDVAAMPGANRQELLSLVGIFRAKVVDISHTGMIIEASGNKEKVEAFIELLRPLGIRDFTRTGCIAIGRLSPASKEDAVSEEEELSWAVDHQTLGADRRPKLRQQVTQKNRPPVGLLQESFTREVDEYESLL